MILFSFTDIGNYIQNIKDFVVNIYDLIGIAFNLLPEPFKEIALGFIVVFIAVIIMKILKG